MLVSRSRSSLYTNTLADPTCTVNGTIARLQSQAKGININSTDAIAMLQLCSYETHALGYSAFCDLFSEVHSPFSTHNGNH